MHINKAENTRQKTALDISDTYMNNCRSLQEREIREDIREGVTAKLGLGETKIWVKEHFYLPWKWRKLRPQKEKHGTHHVDAEHSGVRVEVGGREQVLMAEGIIASR